MPSELRNLESLYLHIRESHDTKISKIIRQAEHRHAKVVLKCLSELANLLIKETESKAQVAVLIKEARNLMRNFVKSKIRNPVQIRRNQKLRGFLRKGTVTFAF